MTSDAFEAVAVAVDARIRDYIMTDVLYNDPGVTLTNNTNLLEGILDSASLMRLVGFLEDEFDVEIEDYEITKSEFATVGTIAALIETKR